MTLISILIPSLALITLISGLPNVAVIPIGVGSCSAYPSTYDTAGRSADAFVFRPSSTDNPSVNNLPTYIEGDTLVASLTNTTDPSIFYCDEGGTIFNGFGTSKLLITANSSSMRLQYLSPDQGIKPETYRHELDGILQAGVFLGSGNVTTWAFGRLAKERSWRVRLLGVGGLEVQRGEVLGFLKVLAP